MMVEPRHRRTGTVLALMAALVLVGCGSDAPDPEAERLERIEHRLERSFSDAQVTCILKGLDDPTLEALDRRAALPADGPALATYTEAVQGCVSDGAAAPPAPSD